MPMTTESRSTCSLGSAQNGWINLTVFPISSSLSNTFSLKEAIAKKKSVLHYWLQFRKQEEFWQIFNWSQSPSSLRHLHTFHVITGVGKQFCNILNLAQEGMSSLCGGMLSLCLPFVVDPEKERHDCQFKIVKCVDQIWQTLKLKKGTFSMQRTQWDYVAVC